MSPGRVLIKSSLVCGLLGILVFSLNLNRIEPPPLNQTDLRFNSVHAYNAMKSLSKGFPNRVTWGKTRVEAGEWLKSEFRKMGYTPRTLQFSEVIAGKQYTNLENIFVEKRG